MMQDAEGTVIRANFGSGASTENRFENAGTRAADLAASEMSPEALVSFAWIRSLMSPHCPSTAHCACANACCGQLTCSSPCIECQPSPVMTPKASPSNLRLCAVSLHLCRKDASWLAAWHVYACIYDGSLPATSARDLS